MLLSLRTCCVLAVLVLLALPAQAQEATVRGFVTDASDGQALPGASVALSPLDDSAVRGGATDADGYYAVSRLDPGRYLFQVSFIGYRTHVDTLTLEADEILTKNLALAPADAEMDEVVVQAEREDGAASTNAGLQTVRPADIERMPSPDVNADLVQYVTTLPGVVSSGDRGGQLFVRGGEPTQNQILVDGMPVFQPFHIVGFYSAFPADLLQQVDFYAGGFGARYGGRLSSVMDVQVRNGNNQRFAGSVSAAPFVVGGQVEGPLVRGKASVIGSFRHSVIEETAPTVVGQELPYRFYDALGKVHATISPSLRASVTAVETYDRGSLNPDEVDSEVVTWKNRAASGRLLALPSGLPFLAEVLLSYSSVESTYDQATAERSSSTGQFDANVTLTYLTEPRDFRFGMFLRSLQLSYELGGQFQNFDARDEYLTEAGLFGEIAFRPVEGLEVTPGLRLESFASVSQVGLSPRLRAQWQPGGAEGRHRFTAAAGRYYQEVVGLSDRRDAGNIFTAWAVSPAGESVPQAWHLIGGYGVRGPGPLRLSVEGFYKWLSDLVVPTFQPFPSLSTSLTQADGTAYGFDVRLEAEGERAYMLLSYGYSQVEYEAALDGTPEAFPSDGPEPWYAMPSLAYAPPHDRRHQVSALGTLTLAGFDLSVRWQFGSGQPYSRVQGNDVFVYLPDSYSDVTDQAGIVRVIYDTPYRGTLPTYHRLDASVERTFRPSARTAITVQGSVLNTYDRQNLFYLDVFTLERVDQLPVLPTLGVKVELR